MIDSGFNQRQSVLILYVVASLMGILAVKVSTSGAGKALMVLIAVVVIGCIALAILTRSDKLHAQQLEQEKQTEDAEAQEPDAQDHTQVKP